MHHKDLKEYFSTGGRFYSLGDITYLLIFKWLFMDCLLCVGPWDVSEHTVIDCSSQL